jgi:Fic family protein
MATTMRSAGGPSLTGRRASGTFLWMGIATKPSHTWAPIAPPSDVDALARPELRALERLWTSCREDLERLGAWQPFWERMGRWWAIETGVIEGVFDVSLGVTRTLVEQGLLASLIPHGESNRPADEVIEILGDHREALDMVLDVVSGARSLTVGWIKELHALLCRHQDTTEGEDQFGQRIRIPLLRGDFKRRPNSVILPSGEKHEYCPPEHVASEMDQLVTMYGQISATLPEVRAAWLHHAFTQIHPFEDGNGRVARALASIDFIRGRLFPLVIERQQRDRAYVPALIAADQGDLSPLVKLFTSRQERAVRRAISDAETITSHATSLDAALDAAQEKYRRREEATRNARPMGRDRLAALASLTASELERVRTRIVAKIPSALVKVFQNEAHTARYWREQIIREAKRGEYWADLHEPWEWAHLSLVDGGKTSFVVVLHFIGNPTPGAAVAIAFVTHRGKTDDETTVLDASQLSLEPLMLYPSEGEAPQRARFLDWLARATAEAIAVWTRYL